MNISLKDRAGVLERQGAVSPGVLRPALLPTRKMKVSAAALSFLILAAALGSQAHVTHDTETRKSTVSQHQFEHSIHHHGFYHPPDCCFSYTQRSIRCLFMTSYFETSSGCSQPGVIFLTKKGQRVCANPSNEQVQDCMRKLKSSPVSMGPGTIKFT
ncbi:PREDICTED: C-C motif chemokine 15-like isoform X2 [Galeopterus variegatus]|uniref:C-C motif chemokine n=1 Tax=Galeopterus variegatus TaxID=482537 RepID=A0ABM0QD59_GALVR|nr:PREDICTED: C-C motif chemokine 15-like isoform X2 [Galeopterus variegatus]